MNNKSNKFPKMKTLINKKKNKIHKINCHNNSNNKHKR